MFWCAYVRIRTVIPLFSWDPQMFILLSQYLKEITPLIIDTVDFVVNTLPKIQYWISGGCIIIGLCLLLIGYLRLRSSEATKARKKTVVMNGK